MKELKFKKILLQQCREWGFSGWDLHTDYAAYYKPKHRWHFRKWKTYDRSLIDLANLQLIENYMCTVLKNINSKQILREPHYCEHDKDCGYRSALRLFGIAQTAKTDDVAERIIYGDFKQQSKPEPSKQQPKTIFTFPLQLAFSW